jgi:hypothetical protein
MLLWGVSKDEPGALWGSQLLRRVVIIVPLRQQLLEYADPVGIRRSSLRTSVHRGVRRRHFSSTDFPRIEPAGIGDKPKKQQAVRKRFMGWRPPGSYRVGSGASQQRGRVGGEPE